MAAISASSASRSAANSARPRSTLLGATLLVIAAMSGGFPLLLGAQAGAARPPGGLDPYSWLGILALLMTGSTC